MIFRCRYYIKDLRASFTLNLDPNGEFRRAVEIVIVSTIPHRRFVPIGGVLPPSRKFRRGLIGARATAVLNPDGNGCRVSLAQLIAHADPAQQKCWALNMRHVVGRDIYIPRQSYLVLRKLH